MAGRNRRRYRIPLLAVLLLGILMYVIHPMVLSVAVMIVVIWSIKRGMRKMQEQSGDRVHATGSPAVRHQGPDGSSGALSRGSMAAGLPKQFETWVDALDVPPVIKHKIRQIALSEGASVEAILASSSTPDVVRRYIREAEAAKSRSAGSKLTDAVRAAANAFKDAPDDDIYDPDEYESVNQEPAGGQGDSVVVNGRRVSFTNRKNPFEL